MPSDGGRPSTEPGTAGFFGMPESKPESPLGAPAEEQWRRDLAAHVADERRRMEIMTRPSPDPAKPRSLIVLGLIGIVAVASSLSVTAFGTSATHQILAAVYFLVFAVCAVGIGIIRTINRQAETIRTEIKSAAAGRHIPG